MEKPELLIKIFELIILLIPIGGLIWKAAKQSGKTEIMEKELKELAQKVAKNEEQQKRDIEELKETQQKDIADLKGIINTLDKKIDVSNEKIITSLAFITDQIKELKKEKNHE